MGDRPYWWDWVADRLPYMGVLFRLWIMFAILVLDDGKGMNEAKAYWENGEEHDDS